ncbi:DUF6973 domain-containing protein [Nocardia noduli]|uniref:DUF6973 domain-containing protein n=1 Tax=Nocardia noduli TaxID=2815722 RepID=UPI001C235E59|nr:hypothetical protein [Nocardia noduli]
MTDANPIRISTVLEWKLSAAQRLPTELSSLANIIETDVEAANREVQNSRDFFDSAAGDAMRSRFEVDRRNALATVDAVDSMAAPVREVASQFDTATATIRDTVRKIEASEYQLFYKDDGQVLSRKSLMDWIDDNVLTGLTKSLSVERTRRAYQSALQGALNDIWTADFLYNGKIGLVLENLPESVREALISIPTDPELARILRENQVAASDTTVVFPSGDLLDKIRMFAPEFEPRAMSKEEAAALVDLATSSVDGPFKLMEFYAIQDEAKTAAASAFPNLSEKENEQSLSDGHSDAFRHAYWNARMTQEFGPEWTSTFASAHEMNGSNPAAREAMDLYNNQLGRAIGAQNSDASPEELQQKVLEAINNNQAIVIQNSPDGGQIAFSNSVLPGKNAILPGGGIPMPGGK